MITIDQNNYHSSYRNIAVRRLRKCCATLVVSIFLMMSTYSHAQWIPGYTYKSKITIHGAQVCGTDPLLNFPVLVQLSNNNLRTTPDGLLQSGQGYDIIFTAADQLTVLDHQIDHYNGASGTYAAWVNIPSLLPGADTEIYMYYGNSTVLTDPSTSSTWNAGYSTIYHFENNNFDDATASGVNSTNVGTTQVTAKLGSGRAFDGIDDYIQTASSELATSNNYTISAWFKTNTTAPGHMIWQGESTVNGWGTGAGGEQEMHLSMGMCCSSTALLNDHISFFQGDREEEVNTDPLFITQSFSNTTDWHYVVASVRNLDTSPVAELFLNGVLIGANTGAASIVMDRSQWDTNLRIGRPGAATRFFNGEIDEVRISNSVRSAEWICTEYNNQNTPSSFLTLSLHAPELNNIEVSSIAFTEGDAPTTVTTSVTTHDWDNADAQSATISITNYVNGEDVLAFTPIGNITGTFDASAGILTLSGTDTYENYQDALRSVTYQNINDQDPSSDTRTVTIVISDGHQNSNTVSRDINIIPVNDAPVINNIEFPALDYNEDDPASNITSTITVADVDNATLTGATIELTSNYVGTEDVLSFTNILGITGTWNSATGTLTLSGTATAADYQTAIRSVTYHNTNTIHPSSSTRTATITVTDGILTATGARQITVSPVNDVPTAMADHASTLEDTGTTISVLANDSDADDALDPSTVMIVSSPLNGSCTVDPVTGDITYLPNANYNGTDSFTYTVQDSNGATSGTTLVEIDITAVNDAPVFTPGADIVRNEDAGTQTIIGWATSIDDGDPEATQTLSFVVTSNSNSTLFSTQPSVNAAGRLVFRPANNRSGTATISLVLRDNGSSTSPDVNESSPHTLTITILSVNDAPTAVNDFFSTSANTALQARVNTNDTDVESNTLTYSSIPVTDAAHGAVTIQSNGIFTYTPDGTYTGTDSFVYEVCDNGTDNGTPASRCSQATVTINVNPENPYYNIVGNNSIEISTHCFTLTPAINYQQGAIWRREPLDLRHSFDIRFDAIFSAPGTTKDASGADGIMFILQRDVTPPPLNVANSPIYAHGAAGQQLGYGGISPSIGIEFDTWANEDDPAFDHVAISRNGSTSNILHPAVAAKVDALGDPLNIEDGVYHSVSIQWNKPTNTLTVWFDGEERISYTSDIITTIFGGNPTNIYWGFTASTGGSNNHQGICGVDMTIINVAPIANDDTNTTEEDTSVGGFVLGNDTDPESGTLLVTAETKATTHGEVEILGDGSYVYMPHQDYHGADHFTYEVCDNYTPAACSQATVTITINSVNDAPLATDDHYNTDEDVLLAVPSATSPLVLANDSDADNDPLTANLVSGPLHGTLTFHSGGSFTYMPNGNYFGDDSFTYTISDGTITSAAATVHLTVNAVNDNPQAEDDNVITDEDISLDISIADLISNDNDLESLSVNPSSISIVSPPLHGTIAHEATNIRYTPSQDYYGSDTFSYTVNDLDGATSNVAIVTINVTPVNDAPVVLNDLSQTQEDHPVNIAILTNDNDVDNAIDPSSITIIDQPSSGILSAPDLATGSITYTPQTGFVGQDEFTYQLSDAQGAISNIGTVVINVTPVNNPPLAVNDYPERHTTILPLIIDAMENDNDPDNDVGDLSIIEVTQPLLGTTIIENGMIVYTPSGKESGTDSFTYTIQDPGGLTSTATVTIIYDYEPLKISEGFSPNGDGNNDTWYIRNIEEYPNNSIQVFDRWGLMVYQHKHYDNNSAPWDGTANVGSRSGHKLEQGTYYYTITLDNNTSALTGYLVIIN